MKIKNLFSIMYETYLFQIGEAAFNFPRPKKISFYRYGHTKITNF